MRKFSEVEKSDCNYLKCEMLLNYYIKKRAKELGLPYTEAEPILREAVKLPPLLIIQKSSVKVVRTSVWKDCVVGFWLAHRE